LADPRLGFDPFENIMPQTEKKINPRSPIVSTLVPMTSPAKKKGDNLEVVSFVLFF
jgi:hypothetical protein